MLRHVACVQQPVTRYVFSVLKSVSCNIFYVKQSFAIQRMCYFLTGSRLTPHAETILFNSIPYLYEIYQVHTVVRFLHCPFVLLGAKNWFVNGQLCD
jgi:hypothetical protein